MREWSFHFRGGMVEPIPGELVFCQCSLVHGGTEIPLKQALNYGFVRRMDETLFLSKISIVKVDFEERRRDFRFAFPFILRLGGERVIEIRSESVPSFHFSAEATFISRREAAACLFKSALLQKKILSVESPEREILRRFVSIEPKISQDPHIRKLRLGGGPCREADCFDHPDCRCSNQADRA